jgi:hypothetical protein
VDSLDICFIDIFIDLLSEEMSERFFEELTIVGELSEQKQQEFESEEQSVNSSQSLIATNEEQNIREEVLKQRIKELESKNQILSGQTTNDSLLLQQTISQVTNDVVIDMSLSNVQSLEDNYRRDSFNDW